MKNVRRQPVIRLVMMTALLCLLGSGISLLPGGELPEVMFILDGSGSMWGPAGDATKIEAAREVMAKVVPGLPEGVKAGLTVYGHRVKGDCGDIETVIPAGSEDRDGMLSAVNAVMPKGKTPIADSVKLVADSLKARENETTIILVSDGQETCNDDPCGVVSELKNSGIKFVLHVVGFGVTDGERKQLECLAEAGGGRYFGATDAGTLLTAMETVTEEVAEKVEQATSTEKKAATKLGKLRVSMPSDATITLGSLELVRVSDGKVIRIVEDPKADDLYPLLAGDYELALLYSNTNYQPPDRSPGHPFTITGGETTEISLGAIGFNVAGQFSEMAMVGVSLREAGSETPLVTHKAGDNDYYMLKVRPVFPGTYEVSYLYGREALSAVLVDSVEAAAGQLAWVDVNTGLRLKPPESGVVGWDLVPGGADEALLTVRRRWDNDYPLWHLFPVPAGSYDLLMVLDGSDEPLPVAEGLEVGQGELVDYDTGI